MTWTPDAVGHPGSLAGPGSDPRIVDPQALHRHQHSPRIPLDTLQLLEQIWACGKRPPVEKLFELCQERGWPHEAEQFAADLKTLAAEGLVELDTQTPSTTKRTRSK
jgi:hypothetical protein